MLSVAKLAPGREAYYEQAVAGGLDDYHAGRGEAPGEWVGAGALELGLAGTVAPGELGQLVAGVDPASGARLRRHYPPREITVTRLDPDTGGRVAATKRLDPVGGFDLVFSVPKSASVLWAIGDDDTSRTIEDAHEQAWRAALRYLEEEACATRSGRNGAIRERGDGFVAAAFRHRTSRAQDPHLHTHVVVANLTRAADGKWRTLEGDALLRSYRLAAGYLYEAHLRYELTSRLGVDWHVPQKGMAEIGGVPTAVLRHFSTRRQQIERHLDDHAATGNGWRAAQVAAIATRERKACVDLATLRADWRARAAEHGLTAAAIPQIVGRARWQALAPGERRSITRELLSPRGLTERETTIASTDLVRAWAHAHRNGAPADDLRALARELVQEPGVVPVADARPGVPARISTQELIAAELRVLAVADRGVGAGAPTVQPLDLIRAHAAATVPLGADQRAMVDHITRSDDRIVCVVGHAGAGKTTALRVAVDALDRRGCHVLGAAPSGIAAHKLAGETGLAATTLHRLVGDADRESGLPQRAVVIVDEAGTADTRTLARLVDHVEQARGKLILVGDPAQLPSVAAGGLFAELVERLGAAEVTSNRRQHDPAERAALARLRAGDSETYLAWAIRNDRVVLAPTIDDARERLLDAWWRGGGADPARQLMLAYRRDDVAALNAAARHRMRASGRLGAAELATPRGPFAVGDRIVCRRNDHLLGVRNGTRGTILSVDPDRRKIMITGDDGQRIALPGRYLDAGHVEHGYAITGHQAQGLTVDRVHVLLRPDGNIREWSYVAASRAASETRVYVVSDELTADRGETLDRALRALGRASAEEPATTLLARSQRGHQLDL